MKFFNKLLVVFSSLVLGASLFSCGESGDGFSIPIINSSEEKPIENSKGEDVIPPVESCDHKYNEKFEEGNCSIPDTITYTCKLCGDSYTEDLGIQHDHQLGEIIFSEEHNADIIACINCDYFEFVEKEEHIHSFKEAEYSFYDIDPNNYHYENCDSCDYKQVSYHQVKEWLPSEDPKIEFGVCIYCSYVCKKEVDVHEHQFSIENYDEQYHFNECTCGERINEVEHIFDKEEVIYEANEWQSGLKRLTCTTCGYFYDVSIEYHRHDHYYYSPSEEGCVPMCECGYAFSNSLITHSYDESAWTVVEKATYYKDGLEENECYRCGNVTTRVVNKGIQNCTLKQETIPFTCEHPTQVVSKCQDPECGYYKVLSTSGVAQHKYEDSEIIISPTCYSGGQTLQECIFGCGNTQIVNTSSLEHSYVNHECERCEFMDYWNCFEFEYDSETESYSIVNINESYAGVNLADLQEIVFPGTYNLKPVTSININVYMTAFEGKDVVIQEGIKEIASNSFYGLGDFNSLILPKSLTFIGSSVYNFSSEGYPVYYNGSINDWVNIEFDDTKSLPNYTNLYVMENGEYDLVDDVVIEGITEIKPYVFYNLQSLKSLYISSDVTTIGELFIQNCLNLEVLEVPFIGENDTSTNYSLEYFFSDLINVNYTLKELTINGGIGIYTYLPSLTKIDLSNVEKMEFIGLNSSSNLSELYLPTKQENISGLSGLSSLKSLELPSSVKTISSNAFANCTNLENLIIPYGVTEIGDYAFSDCDSLKEVIIPKSVTSIGSYVFYGCDSLVNVELPTNIETIGSSLFYDVYSDVSLTMSIDESQQFKDLVSDRSSIKKVTIRGCTAVPNNYFQNYTSLEEVVFLENIETIGDYAFAYTNLSKINLENSLESIGEGAFISTNVNDLIFPSTLTSIGVKAFKDCAELEVVDLSSVEYKMLLIGNSAFENCTSLSKAIMANNVQSFGTHVFYNCRALSEVKLPLDMSSIPAYTFTNCVSLNNYTLQSNISTIESGAFLGITFVNLKLHENVRYINSSAFGNCEIITFICESKIVDVATSAFSNSVIKNAKVCGNFSFKNGSQDSITIESLTILGGDITVDFSLPSVSYLYIEYGVKSIGEGTLRGCTGIRELTLPDTVESIGENALPSSLEKLVIPTSFRITDIMNGVNNLKTILVSNTLVIEDYTFKDCYALEEVDFALRLESIGNYAFSGCTALTKYPSLDQLKSIGTRAFENCDSLESIVLDSNLETIGKGVFYGCDNLVSITIPRLDDSFLKQYFDNYNNVVVKEVTVLYDTEIINNAFNNCATIEKITLNEDITSIGSYAFAGCYNLSEINISKEETPNIETIGSYAFYNCASLEFITIPDNVKLISQSSFAGCVNMTFVLLPNNVETIDNYAFAGCYNLKNIILPSTLTTINSNAFANCKLLTQVINNSEVDVETSEGFENIINVLEDSSSYVAGEIIDNYYVTRSLSDGYLYVTNYYGEGGNVVIPETLNNESYYIWSGTFDKVSSSHDDVVFYYNYLNDIVSITIPSTLIGLDTNIINQSTIKTVYTGKLYDNFDHIFEDSGENIEKLVILEGCEEIGERVSFTYYSNLHTIELPSTLQNIKPTLLVNGDNNIVEIINKSSITLTKGSRDNGAIAVSAVNIYSSDDTYSSKVENFDGFKVVRSNENGKYYLFEFDSRLTLPNYINGETYILNNNVFDDNSYNNLVIPNTIEQIDSKVFADVLSIDTLVLPNSIKVLGDSALSNLMISNLYIPSSIETIGENTFANMRLGSIYYKGDASQWFDFTKKYGAQFIQIDEVSFYEETTDSYIQPTSIQLPSDITTIHSNAFSGFKGLTSVDIPSNITSIGDYAFANCSNLSTINLPSTITSIGEYALSGTKITSFTLPSLVSEISNGLLSNCSGLKTITFNDKVTSIGGYAFADCTSLESVNIPTTVTFIGEYVFNNCDSITSLVIPESVVTMYGGLINDCDNIKTITLNAKLTRLDNFAFSYCDSLETIYYYGSVEDWENISKNAYSVGYGFTVICSNGNVTL